MKTSINTAAERDWVIGNLQVGCKIELDNNKNSTAIITSTTPPQSSFKGTGYVQDWDYKKGLMYHYLRVTALYWPDGSPMIPFQTQDGKPYNPILAKIKQLDTRFLNKTLPKVKSKPLPFPA